ncbi:MAG: thioesterase family protein [Bacteroidota bacterium]
MSEKRITYQGAVMTWECDSNRHMNVMYYVNKFEHGGRILFSQLGLGREYLEPQKIGVVVVEQIFQYKQEVFEDDILQVRSQIIGVGNKVIQVRHEMYQTESNYLAATADLKLLFLDLQARKAITLTDEMKQLLWS